MWRITLIFILILVASCKKPEVPPPSEEVEKPYVGVQFLYPEDSLQVKKGDTIRISIKYRADAGMHEVALVVKDENHNIINIFPKHTHQGNIYIYDTLWAVEQNTKQLWFLGIVNDHLNNFAQDSVNIFIIF